MHYSDTWSVNHVLPSNVLYCTLLPVMWLFPLKGTSHWTVTVRLVTLVTVKFTGGSGTPV